MTTLNRLQQDKRKRVAVRGKVRSGVKLPFPQARHLTRNERFALQEYKSHLQRLLPGRIERIVLYGSKARGDSTPDSDMDVLVVVNGDAPVGRQIDSRGFEMLMKYKILIQSVWMSVDEARHWSPLLDDIWKEGIELWRRRGAPAWVHPESEGIDVAMEKAEAIETRMILARDKLDLAHKIFETGYFNDTISKAYYAMFYAGKAMLLAVGVDPHKHRGVVSLVGEKIVHVGLSDAKYGSLINYYMELRLEADYKPEFHATREQAQESLDAAEDFIQEAQRVLERLGKQSRE